MNTALIEELAENIKGIDTLTEWQRLKIHCAADMLISISAELANARTECTALRATEQNLREELAEARKQMESQKDEWLSWEAKRRGLEKDAELWRFVTDPQSDGYAVCEYFHDGWIPIGADDIDAAMQKGKT